MEYNLVDQYTRLFPSVTKAVQALNEATGRNLDVSRIGQMRNGSRTIPSDVQAAMREMVMPTALALAGIRATAAQAKTLASLLNTPADDTAKIAA